MSDIIFILNSHEQAKARLEKEEKGFELLSENEFFAAFRNDQYTTQSQYEQQPLKFGNGRYLLVADARIDDRINICNKLELDYKTIPSSAIIANAFLKWGKKCLEHLIGEFAFVIYDFDSKEIWAARDQMGQAPLFYLRQDNQVIISSAIYLTQLVAKKALVFNPQHISDYISGADADSDETAYKHVKLVYQAHHITINKKTITTERYWDISFEPLILNTEKEYVDQLLEILNQAISDRMPANGKISNLLSGGLDSSSVAAIASKFTSDIQETYTYIPYGEYRGLELKHRFVNEQPYVEDIHAMYPKMHGNWITIEEKSLFDDLDDLIKYSGGLNVHNYYNRLWIQKSLQKAAEKGYQCLFDGQSGNFTLTPFGTERFQQLFLSYQWKTLCHEINSFSTIHSSSPLRTFASQCIIPSLPNSFRKQLDYWKNGDLPKRVFPFLNQHFETSYNPENFSYLNNRFNKKTKHYTNWLALRYSSEKASVFKKGWERMYGIKMMDPLLDVRLSKFMFRVPSEILLKNGITRNLIRSTTKNLLPESVRMNFRKGLQLSDAPLLYQNDIPKFQEKINIWKQNANIKEALNLDMVQATLKTNNPDSMHIQAMSKVGAISTLLEYQPP